MHDTKMTDRSEVTSKPSAAPDAHAGRYGTAPEITKPLGGVAPLVDAAVAHSTAKEAFS